MSPQEPENAATVLDWYADVQDAIDALCEQKQRIMLLRLAAKFNNGDEHFDHSHVGSSWLCLKCAQLVPGPRRER